MSPGGLAAADFAAYRRGVKAQLPGNFPATELRLQQSLDRHEVGLGVGFAPIPRTVDRLILKSIGMAKVKLSGGIKVSKQPES